MSLVRWDRFADAAPRKPYGGTGETLLLVDDEPGVRSLMRRVLRYDGYRVLEARDGVEALERLEVDPSIALVLSDVAMPRLDGLALCARVARRRPGLPVLLLSGSFPDALPAGGILDLPIDFLAKPFLPTTLRAKVRRLLGVAREARA
jgi:two-component system response regulator MprA